MKLSSRYNDVLTELEVIPGNRGIITTNGNYTRVTTNEEGTDIVGVDFEGGPMLSIGSSLGAYKIKSIKSAYIVEFE